MKTVKTFFRTLYLSCTSPAYYRDIIKAPLSFSFKYYAGMTVVLALIFTTIITIRWIVPFHEFARGVPEQLIAAYPAELEISINNGQVSTNVNEPYVIPISVLEPIADDFNNTVLGINESSIQNLLVIDTQATSSSFNTYQTFALLTWDSISYINDDGNIETVSLEEIDNVLINQTTITATIHEIEPYVDYIVPLAIALVTCGYITYGIIRLIYVGILASMLWLLAKITARMLTYKQSYQVALHANFIPYALLSLITLTGLMQITMPFLETILQIGMMAGILAGLRAGTSAQKK